MRTAREVGPVLVATTAIVIAGLATTLTSGLPTVQLFGIIAAFTLIVAVVGDLVVMPALIGGFGKRWFEPKAGTTLESARIRTLGAAIVATMLLSAATADAGDDPLLKRLVGDWIGTGSFRWDSVSDADPLWCRVSGALDADGTLRQSGRCSLPDQAVSFSVEIHPAGGGKYTGKASGPFGAGGARSPVREGRRKSPSSRRPRTVARR